MRSLVSLSVITLVFGWASQVSAQDYWGDASSAPSGGGDNYAYQGGGGGGGGGFDSLLGESDFDYGYLDASYYFFDFDEEAFDSANGFGVGLAVALFDSSLFLKGAANYASSETDTGADLDYLDWQAGVGLGLPLWKRFDLVLEGGLAHRSIEVDSIDRFDDLVDGYGWYLAPGVRWGLTQYFELNGTVRYVNVDSESDIGIDVRALLHLTPSVSLTGGVLFTDEAPNQYGVGLRLSF